MPGNLPSIADLLKQRQPAPAAVAPVVAPTPVPEPAPIPEPSPISSSPVSPSLPSIPASQKIVFASAEDYPCELAQLEKAMKLAQNIRAVALWAVVDNDTDCTFYIINEVKP